MTNDQLLNVALAVGSVIVALLGTLIAWIVHGWIDRIKSAEAALSAQQAENLRIRNELQTAIQQTRSEVVEGQARVNVEIFDRVNTIQDNVVSQERECASRINDLSVSVAGLQGQYVTKREYDEDRRTRRS